MTKEIKCLIWDLDETLWDGILLESSNVVLKPGVLETIWELDNRGILQSISSKNNRDDVLDKLKELSIKEYFIYPEIGWHAKSASISNIAQNLNIGLDSIAFIDDQAFEREEVMSVHQEVLCIPATDYISLLDMKKFKPQQITAESRKRRLMYQADQQRKEEESSFIGPKEEFLASLDMEIIISVASEDDLQRAEELTIRTNQLNSTGITFDYEELRALQADPDHLLMVCELIDKYGTYGKIGLALIQKKANEDVLKLLLMSCRVISRGIGTVLLTYLMQRTRKAGKRFVANFRQTDRNRMMFITYRLSGFKEVEKRDNLLVLEHDLANIIEFPSYLDIYTPERPYCELA